MTIPKVSVVVPNYNYARFLRKRIDSILAQTFQDFELILLDDCSSDESRSILSYYAADPRVRIIFNEVNSGGIFQQWNKGVKLACGQYVWMAEADDYADTRFLERLTAVLDRESTAGFVYCRSLRVTDDDKVEGSGDWYLDLLDPDRWKTDFCVDGRRELLPYFAQCCIVPNASSALFRRDSYNREGGADESYRVSGDWKIWAAMAMNGAVCFVNEPLNYYRLHSASAFHRSGRDASNLIESLNVIRWILNHVTLSDADLEKVHQKLADGWVPVVMSMHIPFRTKLAIVKRVKAVDPHPLRRIITPTLNTVRRKFRRHFPALR